MRRPLRFFVGIIVLSLTAGLYAQQPAEPSQQQQRAQQMSPPKRVRMSQGVSDKLIVKKVQPSYPEEARKKHMQGSVVLQVLIGKTGEVTDLRVISGDALFVPSTLEAVRQWIYKPFVLNGQPIEVETQVTINYRSPD